MRRASRALAPTICALLLLLPLHAALATPTPPVVLVNHESGLCSQVIEGDDCSWCDPPAGWEVLGPAAQTSCPEGYTQVDAPAMDCRRYETPFCCSGGAHRGDCENMVVDVTASLCGFVDQIEGCTLPGNWQSRPAGVAPERWACPAGYGWLPDQVECRAAPAATREATLVPPAEDTDGAWRGICFGLSCLALVALIFGFGAMFPVWYAARQRQNRTLPPSSRR